MAETFEEWWSKFCDGLMEQSGFDHIPNGMNPECYREYYNRGDSPYEASWQTLDDLSR